jgi:hypothetical protein
LFKVLKVRDLLYVAVVAVPFVVFVVELVVAVIFNFAA